MGRGGGRRVAWSARGLKPPAGGPAATKSPSGDWALPGEGVRFPQDASVCLVDSRGGGEHLGKVGRRCARVRRRERTALYGRAGDSGGMDAAVVALSGDSGSAEP